MFVPLYCLLCILVVECYTKKLPLRIIGGKDAREGEYPFVLRMEIIMNNSDDKIIDSIYHKHICTASAISSTWAITAGHCVYSVVKKRLNVVIRYGCVENEAHHEDTFSEVLFKVMHPLYRYTRNHERKPISMRNDIGLLKTKPMKVTSFGKLSAVDLFSLYGYEAVMAGHGLTTKNIPDGMTLTQPTLNLLKPLQIFKVLMYKCRQQNLRPEFCLAPKCGEIMTTCPGDSGGPLIHPSGVVGVLSMGEPTRGCLYPVRKKRAFIAGHILPISPYIEWIQSYVTA